MKPREQGGVVDSKLNVYGVEGLKVCDLSIAPGNVSAVCSVFPSLDNGSLRTGLRTRILLPSSLLRELQCFSRKSSVLLVSDPGTVL